MTYFLDASGLVKRYVAEPGTDVVRSLVRRRRTLAASRLSSVEVSAAVWRRARARDVSAEIARRIAGRVASDLAAMQVVEVRSGVLDRASDLVSRHPLRAYDAVQLASALWLASETGTAFTFACADARLGAIARAEGLRALDLG